MFIFKVIKGFIYKDEFEKHNKYDMKKNPMFIFQMLFMIYIERKLVETLRILSCLYYKCDECYT